MDLHCAVYQSPLNGVLSDMVSQTHCWTIDGSCSKRVTLELKKFILSEEGDASKQDHVESYSKYLAKMVKLTWKCVSFTISSSQFTLLFSCITTYRFHEWLLVEALHKPPQIFYKFSVKYVVLCHS